MDLSMEQRLAIKFCFKAGKSATETLQMVNVAYGDTVKKTQLMLFMKNIAVNVSFRRNTRTVREKCVDFVVKPEEQN
jgi:hypothetical protein